MHTVCGTIARPNLHVMLQSDLQLLQAHNNLDNVQNANSKPSKYVIHSARLTVIIGSPPTH